MHSCARRAHLANEGADEGNTGDPQVIPSVELSVQVRVCTSGTTSGQGPLAVRTDSFDAACSGRGHDNTIILSRSKRCIST